MASAAFSCSFARRECTHGELFHANYQRTNRTKGSKILRCFPHCCPNHVARSFCGAPLYLDVQLQRDAGDEPPLLLVFGRFRLQQDRGFPIGDLLAPDAIASSIQNDDNPNGEWIKSALLESPPNVHEPPLQWRFEVNGSARWFYGWESGVAKSHRLREHVLDVMVTTPELVADARSGELTEWLRVVATIQSPPFKLISFRRATPEAMSVLSNSSAPTVEIKGRLPNDGEKSARNTTNARDAAPVKHTKISLSVRPQEELRLPRTAIRSADAASRLYDLITIWSFVQNVSLASAVPVTAHVERVFWQRLGQNSMRSFQQRATADQIIASLLTAAGDRGPRRRTASSLTKIAVHIATTLFLDEELHSEWVGVLDDSVDVLLDARELRWRFECLVIEWLWSQLDACVRRADWTVAALVVAIEDDFQQTPHRRSSGSELKEGFELFIAHVRERFIDHQRNVLRLERAPARIPRASMFDGEWIATLDALEIVSSSDYDRTWPTTSWKLVHLMWFWRQFSAVSIHFDGASRLLSFQSRLHYYGNAMELTLDHRCRWFRHWPCGESSIAVSLGAQQFGDYVGKVSPSERELHINCYAWPNAGGAQLWATCFQLHLTVSESSGNRIHVRVTVNRGRLELQSFHADDFPTLPLQKRLALVPQWVPSDVWICSYKRSS